MKISLKTLAEFLVEAKKKSWAGGAKETEECGIRRIAPVECQFADKGYSLRFADSYVAGGKDRVFQGLEVVWMIEEKWTPVWAMSYRGQYLGTKREKRNVNEVLKQALQAVSIDAPFRGPKYFGPKPINPRNTSSSLESNYYYENRWTGDTGSFSGNEHIGKRHPQKLVHSLDYFGGLIK